MCVCNLYASYLFSALQRFSEFQFFYLFYQNKKLKHNYFEKKIKLNIYFFLIKIKYFKNGN